MIIINAYFVLLSRTLLFIKIKDNNISRAYKFTATLENISFKSKTKLDDNVPNKNKRKLNMDLINLTLEHALIEIKYVDVIIIVIEVVIVIT